MKTKETKRKEALLRLEKQLVSYRASGWNDESWPIRHTLESIHNVGRAISRSNEKQEVFSTHFYTLDSYLDDMDEWGF